MPQSSKDPIEAAGFTIRFLVDSEESNGSVSVFHCGMAAGAHQPVPHSHDGFEETIYGLTGVTTFTVNGRPTDIGPGDALCIPRGAVHGFVVKGDEDASFLGISTPGLFGPDYFHEMAEILAAAGDGPPDREALIAVMLRHGLTPAVPAAS